MIVDLRGPVATVTLTPSAELFARFDPNHDGLISRDEARSHRAEMLAHIGTGLNIRAEHDNPAVLVFTDLNPPHAHGAPAGAGRKYVRVTLRFRFERPVSVLTVRYAYGAIAPLTAAVRRWAPRAPKRTVEQWARFRTAGAQHTFFGAVTR